MLTLDGFALIERLVVSHVATEAALISALSPAEHEQLKALLAKVAAGEGD